MTNLQLTTATITNNPATTIAYLQQQELLLPQQQTIEYIYILNNNKKQEKQQTYILIINTRAKNIQKTQPKIMFITINRTKNSRSFHLVHIIYVFR